MINDLEFESHIRVFFLFSVRKVNTSRLDRKKHIKIRQKKKRFENKHCKFDPLPQMVQCFGQYTSL